MRVGVVAIVGLGTLAMGAASSQAQSTLSFAAQSNREAEAITSIEGTEASIESLRNRTQAQVAEATAQRQQAAASNLGGRLLCIDQQLQLSQATARTARDLSASWSLGQNNPAFAQRTLERLEVLQFATSAYEREARACQGGHQTAFSLTVIHENREPAPNNLKLNPYQWSPTERPFLECTKPSSEP